ncbi:TatD family hydrolase [Reinekea marinisedimentorum]|uniref:TatD DNase family protein n=1 Tax=Reinekea marinisedimentorum TaxID=230495 RepID=A0A4R3IBM2_9GAMM|nr:TatD family hydrolase [Reinekea marinisedimentorum]TCS43005.1 TatD DNase family protein [Reinekea marinisedimentorum]
MPTTEFTESCLAPACFIDSHCHLDAVDGVAEKLAQARAQGIAQFIVPGIEPDQWPQVIGLNSEGVFCALGTHPWYVNNPEQEARSLAAAIVQHSPVAIGEIGLDFYQGRVSRPAKDIQIDSLNRQMALADQHGLPVILHGVKAHNELLQILKKFPRVCGVVHAFSGSLQIAEQYLALGYCLGAGPLVLQSPKLQQVFRQLPMSRIVLETDAPFMANKSAGGDNPLLALREVAEALATARAIPLASFTQACRENTQRLFSRLPAKYLPQ